MEPRVLDSKPKAKAMNDEAEGKGKGSPTYGVVGQVRLSVSIWKKE
jgi:hypothetical protein